MVTVTASPENAIKEAMTEMIDSIKADYNIRQGDIAVYLFDKGATLLSLYKSGVRPIDPNTDMWDKLLQKYPQCANAINNAQRVVQLANRRDRQQIAADNLKRRFLTKIDYYVVRALPTQTIFKMYPLMEDVYIKANCSSPGDVLRLLATFADNAEQDKQEAIPAIDITPKGSAVLHSVV